MNDSIKIKSGILGGRTVMPPLPDRELGYQTHEEALYIGTSSGKNVKLCDSKLEERITVLEGSPSGIFCAIYGETSAQDIKVAYKTGKAISCKVLTSEDYGRNLWLTDVLGGDASDIFFFSAVYYSETENHLMIITTKAEPKDDESTQWYEIYKQPLVMQEEIDKINARLDALAPSE